MSPTGHLAIGFTAKKYAPQIPVFVFLIAAYALDFIYFICLLSGIDTPDFDPWSHSLMMAVIWSISAGAITLLFCRKIRSGLVMSLVVFSHWILDIIVWDDIPIFFDQSNRIGFGFYGKIGFSLSALRFNSGTVIASSIELGMLVIGVTIYILYLRKLRNATSDTPRLEIQSHI